LIIMSFDGNVILAGLLVGGIGFVLLSYGWRMKRLPQVLAGIALLVYPYFVGNAVAILCIAPVVLLLLWLLIRWGW
jgi:hypothetical protein